METFERIRRDRDREGLSIRALAERHGVHRRAVRQALVSPAPPAKRAPVVRLAPKLDAYRGVVDARLEGDRDAPRKQCHTVRRVWQRLVAEHGAQVSEWQVSRYDNLGSAVKQVLKGRRRFETHRFVALRSHFMFESQFTLPAANRGRKGGSSGRSVAPEQYVVSVPDPNARDPEDDEGGTSATIRIVLADDHPVVRRGLRMLLDDEGDFEVVAEAGDVDSARRHVRGHHPAVLVLDLNMPGGTSLEAIPTIRTEFPETQIVVLTMQQEPAYAREALAAGATGYVLKQAADRELVEAVRLAAVGERYLNPRLGARIAAEPPPGPPDNLSEREVDVLRLIALGHTNAEIAQQLFISGRTVESHRSRIQQKLMLSSRAELVRYALNHGLLDT